MDRLRSSNMEKILCSGDTSLGQMQSDDAAQQNWYSVDEMLQALCRALLDSKRENKELAAENAALKGEAAERGALQKEAAKYQQRVAVYNISKRKVDDHNAALTVEDAALRKYEEQNAALSAIIEDLKKHMDSTASLLDQVRDDSVNVEISMDIARANEEEFEKDLENLKTMIMVKDEENFMLSIELQLQQLEIQSVENHWKVKYQALQDKLRCIVLEEEANFEHIEDLLNYIMKTKKELSAEQKELELLILQNIELQDLASKTDKYKEKVKKEKKEKKKKHEKKE